MNPAGKYATAIVVAHLLVNMAHGLAHRELHVRLPVDGAVFVIMVVLVCPLLAMALVWTAKKRLGLILLLLSMSSSHTVCTGRDQFISKCCFSMIPKIVFSSRITVL